MELMDSISVPIDIRTPVSSVSVFFFSSRRRHTRLQGDWSSDVCSSDLASRAIARPSSSRRRAGSRDRGHESNRHPRRRTSIPQLPARVQRGHAAADHRSEEHTSELQSPCNLVCRLLLEKKKTIDSTLTSRANANLTARVTIQFPKSVSHADLCRHN